MYCPNCGQEQVSGDLRFCSKCGLPMVLVAELLQYGGTLPQLEELAKKKGGLFTRKNGIFLSIIWFIFFTPFMAAISGGVFGIDELAAFFAIFGVFSSMIIFLFSLFFLRSSSASTQSSFVASGKPNVQQNFKGAHSNKSELPPKQTQSAQDYVSPQVGTWKAPDTGELVTPGSVTEGTTRLLKKDRDE